MAKTKESTTPKAKEAKETKPAKAGIAKRTPVRALPVKLSRAKSVVPSEDMLFMWKIMQVSVMELYCISDLTIDSLHRLRGASYVLDQCSRTLLECPALPRFALALAFALPGFRFLVHDHLRHHFSEFSQLRYLSAVASSESSGKGTNSSDTNKNVDGSESPKKDIDSTEADEDVDSSKSPKKDAICSE
ncbi:hypothetical protein PCH_Pc16g13070 [Penicillium rubens Wisconsin 54-1255]|uniref:Uncharacterized protein n=1 Tax=Penicillium rubens (strain ATCC 28089 / DSM 1075 / NRRL 1951 / Wisconsin 54-1255) TaxID=500485 RepID=B6HAJ8_PENRW|nr:hypothetical protein PCH_Pc16g13070 [Penicillium rubens Wisconsin 54-1255]